MSDSESTYERLVAPIEGQMMRSVWRVTRDVDDAEEAFQNVLANVWQRIETVEAHPNPHALILRMCSQAAWDVVRRRGTRERHEADAPEEAIPAAADAGASPVEAIAQRQLGAELREAIATLSPNQSAAVTLRYLDELSYDDIALALSCTAATAPTRKPCCVWRR